MNRIVRMTALRPFDGLRAGRAQDRPEYKTAAVNRGSWGNRQRPRANAQERKARAGPWCSYADCEFACGCREALLLFTSNQNGAEVFQRTRCLRRTRTGRGGHWRLCAFARCSSICRCSLVCYSRPISAITSSSSRFLTTLPLSIIWRYSTSASVSSLRALSRGSIGTSLWITSSLACRIKNGA